MKPEQRIQNALDDVLKACGQSFHAFNMLNEADVVSDALATMRKIMADEYLAGSKDCHESFVKNIALRDSTRPKLTPRVLGDGADVDA